MAVVTGFKPGHQNVLPHKTSLECYYQILSGAQGEIVLHLSTFGSKDRESHPKSSQSMQLNEQAAQQLAAILKSTFPSLEGDSRAWASPPPQPSRPDPSISEKRGATEVDPRR